MFTLWPYPIHFLSSHVCNLSFSLKIKFLLKIHSYKTWKYTNPLVIIPINVHQHLKWCTIYCPHQNQHQCFHIHTQKIVWTFPTQCQSFLLPWFLHFDYCLSINKSFKCLLSFSYGISSYLFLLCWLHIKQHIFHGYLPQTPSSWWIIL
jgi:hypothetical protein